MPQLWVRITIPARTGSAMDLPSGSLAQSCFSPHVLRPRVSVGRNYVPQKRKGTREKNLSLGPFSLRLVRSAHATGVTCGRGTTLGIIIYRFSGLSVQSHGHAANDTGIVRSHKEGSHRPGGSPYPLNVITWCALPFSPLAGLKRQPDHFLSNDSREYPEKLSGPGGVISWMDMNDCQCVRGHASDLIEQFCDGGASSRQVARQQVVHNEKVSVGRNPPRCRQLCQLTHAGRLASPVESFVGHLVHRIF
jgi:hypothetical protein